MIELVLYMREDGRSPFDEWLSGLRDKMAQVRIFNRMRQMEAGTLVIAPLLAMVSLNSGMSVVILLCGGDKSSQAKDIDRAKLYWEDWKRG